MKFGNPVSSVNIAGGTVTVDGGTVGVTGNVGLTEGSSVSVVGSIETLGSIVWDQIYNFQVTSLNGGFVLNDTQDLDVSQYASVQITCILQGNSSTIPDGCTMGTLFVHGRANSSSSDSVAYSYPITNESLVGSFPIMIILPVLAPSMRFQLQMNGNGVSGTICSATLQISATNIIANENMLQLSFSGLSLNLAVQDTITNINALSPVFYSAIFPSRLVTVTFSSAYVSGSTSGTATLNAIFYQYLNNLNGIGYSEIPLASITLSDTYNTLSPALASTQIALPQGPGYVRFTLSAGSNSSVRYFTLTMS